MNFASVENIAAAVLYEGYILYPYRPTAIKNRQRWNFGTLYPREYGEAQKPRDPFSLVSECLVEGNDGTRVDLRVRFLQLIRQQRPIALDAADPPLEWDEGVERTGELCGVLLRDLASQPISLDIHFESNEPAAQQVPTAPQETLRGLLTISAARLTTGIHKLRVELENVTSVEHGAETKRDEALAQSFVSAHLLLGVTDGEFVSLLETPEEHREAAAACHNTGVFPVLAGEDGQRTIMLCSPIILYDYPKIAPESPGDFFDGTEMDEMLALRVLTLTDEEKQEMRNGDARARMILERTEAMTEGHLMKVHGAVRGLRPMQEDALSAWDPFSDSHKTAPQSVRVFGIELRTGDRVRLWPQKKADIMDMALAGKVAVIEAIEQDFEDQIQFAVVLDDDPGREFGMMRQPGHRFFFAPEEVEPLEPIEASDAHD